MVRPGGLIAGHDFVRWVSPTDRYGVVEAVNDLVSRTRSPFVFVTNQIDKHDSPAIRVNKWAPARGQRIEPSPRHPHDARARPTFHVKHSPPCFPGPVSAR